MLQKNRNQRTAISVLAIAVGMFLLCYASVPLYRMFCVYTGFGGTTQDAIKAPSHISDREMTVMFNADVMPQLPWSFAPEQRKIRLKIGEQKIVFFHATNHSDKPLTGVSTFNVTPDSAGLYFMKVKCFCYDAQTIQPNETVAMPVSFFLDPSLQENHDLDDLTTITLSYTFFKVKK